MISPSVVVTLTAFPSALRSMRSAHASRPVGDVQKTKYARRRGSASTHCAGKVGRLGTLSTFTRGPEKRPSLSRSRSALVCSGFTRVAARTLAHPPNADVCPQGFDGLVARTIAWVATKAYRHLLGPDFHRLR